MTTSTPPQPDTADRLKNSTTSVDVNPNNAAKAARSMGRFAQLPPRGLAAPGSKIGRRRLYSYPRTAVGLRFPNCGPSTSSDGDISGRTAIVTGAASGIGLGIATALAEAGANVVM